MHITHVLYEYTNCLTNFINTKWLKSNGLSYELNHLSLCFIFCGKYLVPEILIQFWSKHYRTCTWATCIHCCASLQSVPGCWPVTDERKEHTLKNNFKRAVKISQEKYKLKKGDPMDILQVYLFCPDFVYIYKK